MQSGPSRHLSFNNESLRPSVLGIVFATLRAAPRRRGEPCSPQDRFDADVNMLFFVLWAAENYRALNVADIRELIALPRRRSRRSSSPKQFPSALTAASPNCGITGEIWTCKRFNFGRASTPPRGGTLFGSTLYRTGRQEKKRPARSSGRRFFSRLA